MGGERRGHYLCHITSSYKGHFQESPLRCMHWGCLSVSVKDTRAVIRQENCLVASPSNFLARQ